MGRGLELGALGRNFGENERRIMNDGESFFGFSHFLKKHFLQHKVEEKLMMTMRYFYMFIHAWVEDD